MKTYKEWRLSGTDPEWDQLKYVWGVGNKHVDPTLVARMKIKIESIKEAFIRDLGDPKITNFRELPPHMRDSLAQALVVATLKAFYADLGTQATGSKSVFDQRKLGKVQDQQQEIDAPERWKGF